MRNITWQIFIISLFFFISNFMHLQEGRAMQLSSTAFNDNEQIPQKYCMPGAGGKNISLPLTWFDTPNNTKSFALTIVDPHPVANNWIHWMVINIPAKVTYLEEGASGQNMPAKAKELKNSFGQSGYGGPQPPKGTGEHPYVVTIYALNTESLNLDADTSLSEFQKSIQGKLLDQAELTGMFEQK